MYERSTTPGARPRERPSNSMPTLGSRAIARNARDARRSCPALRRASRSRLSHLAPRVRLQTPSFLDRPTYHARLPRSMLTRGARCRCARDLPDSREALAFAGHLGCDGAGIQPLAAPNKMLIDDAAGQAPAAHDEPRRDAMNNHIALVHVEIEQRLGTIVVVHENR